VAANLIERLEGPRRTWMGQPDAAARGFARIADESLDSVIIEYEGVMGVDGWGPLLRREITETFLPRYTRLAIAHNAIEERGYGAWRGGDPLGRVVSTGFALLVALAIEQIFRHPATLVLLVGALLVPLMPELRAWYYRSQYARQLQQAVDDLGRIQRELERYASASAGDPVYTDDQLQRARQKAQHRAPAGSPPNKRV